MNKSQVVLGKKSDSGKVKWSIFHWSDTFFDLTRFDAYWKSAINGRHCKTALQRTSRRPFALLSKVYNVRTFRQLVGGLAK